MNKKIRVVCHMYSTLDGKINEALKNYPENEDCDFAGQLYEDEIFNNSKIWGCGKDTLKSANEVDLTKFDISEISYDEDNIVKDEYYFVVFDRKGKTFYDVNYFDYASHKGRLIIALTKKATKEYLAYLKSMGIGYLICGDENLDLNLFLTKISTIYGFDTFYLTGGPKINSSFIKEDLVDEISLVICPGIQGGRKELTFVGIEDNEGFPKFFKLKEAKIYEHNTLKLTYLK